MILALLALQVAAAGLTAQAPTSLMVSNATKTVTVPLVAGAHGPLLRPELLSPVVPLTLKRISPLDYMLTISGVELHLEPGSAAVKVGNDVRQLASAPEVRAGKFLVPLQFVSEVLPHLVPNLRWDAERGRLVAFSKVERAGPAPPAARKSAGGDVRQASRGQPAKTTHLVIVDAGHGGVDPGMSGPVGRGPKIHEKDITLQVAKRLGTALKSRGVDVVYTRTTDTLIALVDRGLIANRAGGDLFISVHVNAANLHWKNPGAARGFETYFLAEARTEDARRVEQMENEAVRFETGPDPAKDDPLSFILSDMMQNEHLRESSELAEIIQDHMAEIHPGPSRGVKQAGFVVLVKAYMPSVLVEIGFGTNPQEAKFISDPRQQARIANAIADAAMEYLQRYDRRVSGPRQ